MRGSGLVWVGPGRACGGSMPDSLASYDRELRSWRTSQGCLLSASMPFLGIWPRQGMTRSGRLYGHRMLGRRTGERECSSSRIQWPTARHNQAMSAGITAESAHATNRFPNLETVVGRTVWPTPRSEDSESSGARHSRGVTDTLTSAARVAGLRGPERRSTSGSRLESSPPVVLNPRWVACLMGFPADYLNGVEVPSGRSGTR